MAHLLRFPLLNIARLRMSFSVAVDRDRAALDCFAGGASGLGGKLTRPLGINDIGVLLFQFGLLIFCCRRNPARRSASSSSAWASSCSPFLMMAATDSSLRSSQAWRDLNRAIFSACSRDQSHGHHSSSSSLIVVARTRAKPRQGPFEGSGLPGPFEPLRTGVCAAPSS